MKTRLDDGGCVSCFVMYAVPTTKSKQTGVNCLLRRSIPMIKQSDARSVRFYFFTMKLHWAPYSALANRLAIVRDLSEKNCTELLLYYCIY